jgi:hypothetical protein
LPAYRNGSPTGKMKTSEPFPVTFWNGFGPKTRLERAFGSPLYH